MYVTKNEGSNFYNTPAHSDQRVNLKNDCIGDIASNYYFAEKYLFLLPLFFFDGKGGKHSAPTSF